MSYVREAAVLSGLSAYLAGRAMRHGLGEVVAQVERESGRPLPHRLREELDRTLADVERAGQAWHDELSASGNVDGAPPTPPSAFEVPVSEAAHRLNMSPRTLRWEAANGRVPARKVGGRWLIRIDAKDQ